MAIQVFRSAGWRLAISQGLTWLGGTVEHVRGLFCPEPYRVRYERSAVDAAIAAAFAAAAALYAAIAFSMIDPRVYDSWNIYFHADGIRVLADMTERLSSQWRTNAHPLVPILAYPLMHALMALGLSKLAAAAVLMVGCAALTTGLLYLALRGLDLPKPSAAVFTCVFLASATFVHWFAYVETYAFAALTTAIVLFVLTSGRSGSLWVWTLASAGALAVTVSNWGLALAAGFFRLPLWAFLRTAASAFILVAVLACAQKLMFPQALLFFNPFGLKGDVGYTQIWLEKHGYGKWTPIDNVRTILIASAIAPPPHTVVDKTQVGDFTVVSNLHVPLLAMTWPGIVAAASWVLMLGAGVWGAVRSIPHRAVAVPIVVYVLFEVLSERSPSCSQATSFRRCS